MQSPDGSRVFLAFPTLTDSFKSTAHSSSNTTRRTTIGETTPIALNTMSLRLSYFHICQIRHEKGQRRDCTDSFLCVAEIWATVGTPRIASIKFGRNFMRLRGPFSKQKYANMERGIRIKRCLTSSNRVATVRVSFRAKEATDVVCTIPTSRTRSCRLGHPRGRGNAESRDRRNVRTSNVGTLAGAIDRYAFFRG